MYAHSSLYSEWFYHEIQYKPVNVQKLSAGTVGKASDLQGGMHKSHLAPPCLSVNSPFASDLTFVYALIIGLLLTSKSQNMIIILEFPNGKNVNWEVQQNVNDHTYKLRKPSFTASATSLRILVHAKPCPKSTFYRFKFHLRIIPGRGKCILCSQVATCMITWPAKFDLCAKLSDRTWLSSSLFYRKESNVIF